MNDINICDILRRNLYHIGWRGERLERELARLVKWLG